MKLIVILQCDLIKFSVCVLYLLKMKHISFMNISKPKFTKLEKILSSIEKIKGLKKQHLKQFTK